MERLTETKFEREMRIGFAMIDRHFENAISKLDDMKKEYERKLIPTHESIIGKFHDSMVLLLNSKQSQFDMIGMSNRQLNALYGTGIQNDNRRNAAFGAAYGYQNLISPRMNIFTICP